MHQGMRLQSPIFRATFGGLKRGLQERLLVVEKRVR